MRIIHQNGDLTYQNEEVKDTDIACQLTGTSGFMQKWYWMVCAIILIGFLVFAFVTFIKQCKLEYVYLVLGLTFGMVFILCLPPYTAPDEGTHISTTYAFVNEFLGEEPIFDEENHVISRGTDGDIGGEAQVSLAKFHDVYEAAKYPSGGYGKKCCKAWEAGCSIYLLSASDSGSYAWCPIKI